VCLESLTKSISHSYIIPYILTHIDVKFVCTWLYKYFNPAWDLMVQNFRRKLYVITNYPIYFTRKTWLYPQLFRIWEVTVDDMGWWILAANVISYFDALEDLKWVFPITLNVTKNINNLWRYNVLLCTLLKSKNWNVVNEVKLENLFFEINVLAFICWM